MAGRPTDKDFAAMRAWSSVGPDTTPAPFAYGRRQDPNTQTQVPQLPADGTKAPSFNVNNFIAQAPVQFAGRSGVPLPQAPAQRSNGMGSRSSQLRTVLPPGQPVVNQLFTQADFDAWNRDVESNPLSNEINRGFNRMMAGTPNYQVQEGFTPAAFSQGGHRQLHPPRFAGDFQVPNSQSGASGSFGGSGPAATGPAPQGLASNKGQMALPSHQNYNYGQGQPNLLTTPPYQPNEDQFGAGPDRRAMQANQTRLSAACPPSHAHPPPAYPPHNYFTPRQYGRYGAPAGAEVNAFGGNPALIGSQTGYGRPQAQRQAQFGAYGGPAFNFSGKASLTGVSVGNTRIRKSASASPEVYSGVSSEEGYDGQDDAEDTSTSSFSSDAAPTDPTANATTALVTAQNPPSGPNTRTDQNNVAGRVNNASKYGADIRGRPSLQARPPFGIDITADEILAYYPNALQHPEVVMRLTKAGWTKRDLAKAQLYATGNLTKAKLKTSEDRIQKQIGEGGRAYFRLGRRTKWSKNQHLNGQPMFDDLTANGWNFRHHHDKSFPNLHYQDVPLAAISAFVVNKPQNRGLLTWILEYAEANPDEEYTTAQFDEIIREQNLQIPARLNSAHDVQALNDMRAILQDLPKV